MKEIKTILRRTKSNKAFEILDSTEANGSDWQEGGCWILADALSEYYGLPLYVVYNKKHNRVDHFMVKIGSEFLDSEGIRSPYKLIEDMTEIYPFSKEDLEILPYDPNMETEDIVRDLEASEKLIELWDK